MSLYGDLPTAKDDSGSKGWAASKKLQPTFRQKSSILAPPSVARGGGGRTPTAAGRGAGRGPPPVTNTVIHTSAGSFGGSNANPAPAAVHSAFSFFTVNGEPLKDEYDPSRPNDYEEIMRQREKRKQEAEEEAERLARMREIEQEIERRKREQAEAAAFVAAASRPPPGAPPPSSTAPALDEEDEAAHTFQGGLGAAAAAGLGLGRPGEGSAGFGSGGSGGSGDLAAAAAGVKAEPGSSRGAGAGGAVGDDEMDEYERERQRRLKMSGEEAFRARGRISGASPAGHPPGTSGGLPPDSSGFGGLSGFSGAQSPAAAAQQQQQQQHPPGGSKGMGLAQKLLEKMGWREGQGLGRHRQGMATPLVAQKTAANAGVIVNAEQHPDKRPRLQGAAFNGPPTRVLLLRNMVGPGEVDEDLEEEVGTELTRYGTVEDVMIFEVTTPGYAPEEAVRIFIQFDRAEAATRALVDLQGRFFGGRQVRVAFFSEERFEKQQLAPQAGEFGEGS